MEKKVPSAEELSALKREWLRVIDRQRRYGLQWILVPIAEAAAILSGIDAKPPIVEAAVEYEVRRNDNGTVDEVVAHGVRFAHLEQMDAGSWWLGLDLKGGRSVRVVLSTRRGAAIDCSDEVDDSPRKEQGDK